MFQTGKRLLAIILCLATILPCVPVLTFAADTDTLKKIEAEDTLCAVWNGYNTTENNTNASGGVQVGGSDASKNVYYEDLKSGVDLSNTAYVKWTVEAPSAGNYNIALREHVQIGGSHSGSLKDKVYVSFFVNGKDAYKASFNGENKWVYDTDVVSVALNQGANEIIAIPLVKDIIDANSWGWANVDCLYMDKALSARKNRMEAEHAEYAVWNGYNTTENNTNASGGVQVGGADASKNVYYADLKPGVDLSNTGYIQWTVDAPVAGDYPIAMRAHIKIGGSHSGSLAEKVYVTFFVNGETAYKAKFNGENGWVYDTDAVSVALNKGVNEIIAIPLVKDIIDANSWGWANADCLYLDNRLIACEKEKEPTLVAAEAEDTQYAKWNNFTTTENRTDASGGVIVGGGSHGKNIAYADLQKDADLSSTAYVKWMVEAPEAGEYALGLRYLFKASNQSNDTALDDKAYAAFFINGETAYQANFLGKNGWVYDTQNITVSLNKGRNEIIAIPLVREVIEAFGSSWANVDCLYVDPKLSVVEPEDPIVLVKAEAEDTQYAQWNNYSTTENRTDASGGVIVGGGKPDNNLFFGQLVPGADLSNTAYVKWTVNAPADGSYAIALRYLMKAGPLSNGAELDSGAYAAFFINEEAAYKAKFLGKNNWVYDTDTITVELKQGKNEIVAIPFIMDLLQSYGSGWANVDCLYYDDRLTLEEAPRQPQFMVVEAEDRQHTGANLYLTVEERGDADGGKVIGGGKTDGNVSFGQLVSGVDLSNTAYVAWNVEAPQDGEYIISLRYLMKAKDMANDIALSPEAYAAFFVNGEAVYKAAFMGKNGWVYTTQTLNIALKQGQNEIIAIPIVRDLVAYYGECWANVDSVYLDDRLTVLAAPEVPNGPEEDVPMLVVEAEDTVYTQWNSYSQVQEHNSASGGKMAAGGSANRNVFYADLIAGVNLSSTAYVKWTFTAPAAGEYRFRFRYNPRGSDVEVGEVMTPEGYAAFFVNGQTAYQATFQGKNDWVYDTKTIKVTLQEGENEIVVIPMVRDLYDAWGGGWANADCLYYDTALTLEKAPVKIVVEAEDRSLTHWNGYNTQEPHNSASGGYQAAGSSAQNNVYYKQLKKGVDLTYTSYVKWVVTAPEEGDYPFTVRYAPNADDIKSGKPLTPEGYAAFFVNGQTAYKATFMGYDNWVYNTEEISIHLKQGDNEIVVIPMVKDLYNAWGGGWANVDCLYMDGALSVKPTGYVEERFTIAEAEDLKYVQWNLYNTTEKNSSATNKIVAAGSNSAANIYAKDLVSGADLSGTAYLKWTILAPADGTYKFKLRYTAKEDGVKNGDAFENGIAYATFFVNDADAYTAKLSGFGARCNWLWDTDTVRIKLKEGENELYVIPLIKDQYDAWGGGWANVDCLKMDTRLKLKEAPVYTRFEAEYSEYNLYEAFKTHVGTEDWGSAWENDITYENLSEDNILGIAYSKYYVYAEKAGTYRLGFGFRQGHNLMEYKDAFFGLFVNLKDKYKVPFTATNAGNYRLVYMDVELQEGDNYIYCTACMKDLMDYPKYPSQKNGYVLWIDHDYILLPEGLTSMVASTLPNWSGDAEADYNQSLASVWGDLTGQPKVPVQDAEDTIPSKGDSSLGWILGISAGVLITVLLIVLLWRRKKKK